MLELFIIKKVTQEYEYQLVRVITLYASDNRCKTRLFLD